MQADETDQDTGTAAVDVVVYTFNQKDYLAETLDSILAQKTTFPFRIVVHDDASTDGTREIIEDYANRHPDLFHRILQTENQHSKGHRIVTFVWPHLRAEYVALIDGDDTWINTEKLQKQFDFMNANPDCALCHTQVDYFDHSQGKVVQTSPPRRFRRPKLPVQAMANGNFVHTVAVMIRRSTLPELPADFGTIGFGDYALFSLVARAGFIGFIPETMAQYRIHGTNAWFQRTHKNRVRARDRAEAYIMTKLSDDQRRAWKRSQWLSLKGLLRKARRITDALTSREE
ncbi:MAG: glycosyltransferase [Silicimonas sp.]|nr:glycosyltransferase [Silicimonas sp.]